MLKELDTKNTEGDNNKNFRGIAPLYLLIFILLSAIKVLLARPTRDSRLSKSIPLSP